MHCYRCRTWKKNEGFAIDRNRTTGFQSLCKPCMSLATTASRYRLTRSELTELKARGCAICDATESIVVDHCHRTDKIRDALCQRCNAGIGLFLENSDLMKRAIAYLEKHNGREN